MSSFPLMPLVAPAESSVVLVHTAIYSNPNNLTTFTADDQDFGTPASNRYIFVAVYGGGTGTRSITSLTVGGVSASRLVGTGNSTTFCDIWVAAVPTGATGTVVVTYSDTLSNMGFALYAAYGLKSVTPVATDSAATTDVASCNVAAAKGGFILGVSVHRSTSENATWSGLTPTFAIQVETGTTARRFSAAVADNLAPSAGVAVSATITNGTTSWLAVASMR
jgi:hypothetical protein